MSAVLDSLVRAIALWSVVWLVVMSGFGAALAHRLGWRAGIGALLGLAPIPFFGWVIVYLRWRRHSVPSVMAVTDHRQPADPELSVLDDWSRP